MTVPLSRMCRFNLDSWTVCVAWPHCPAVPEDIVVNVLIVGAGLGGLAAALSLHAAGIEVQVVDAAHELRAVGVGINILPHATRELVELGLAGELAATGIPTQELIYHDRFGSRIWVEP